MLLRRLVMMVKFVYDDEEFRIGWILCLAKVWIIGVGLICLLLGILVDLIQDY